MSCYDILVVGAGLTGAVFAERAAQHGKKVLVIDKRTHLGGNAYTEKIGGIDVHRYGPHIFHTNDDAVWEYVNRFAKFNNFVNSPIANYKGEIYSLPFNMYTFNKMWGVITPDEAKAKIDSQRLNTEPTNLEEQALHLVGTDIYEKLIKGYTEKQWGRECKELPAFIINRLPVRFTYDNNYFTSKYQGIPIEGYTRMIWNMLIDIDVKLGIDFLKERDKYERLADVIVYTGSIDEYFGYVLGQLEYRSIRFEVEDIFAENYQGNAVVNYTDKDVPYTRIIEHKWFNTGDKWHDEAKHTIISREYSQEWKPGVEPYYPINDEKNNSLYQRYKTLADNAARNVIFAGRLGEYKYYDMDVAIANALKKSNELLAEVRA